MYLKLLFSTLVCIGILSAEHFEMGLGGGWRKDRLAHTIYVPSNPDQINYKETLLLSPIWEVRGFMAGMYRHFELRADLRFAPYSHGSHHITDRVFSIPISGVDAAPQYAKFSDQASGYTFDALGTLYYDFTIGRWFHFLPLVGYTYDTIKERRKHVRPTPLLLSPNVDLTFTAQSPQETTTVFGPFIGGDVKFDILSFFHLQAGYEYQFLHYQTLYYNQELYTQGDLKSIVEISHKLKSHDAFAHQGHILLSWEATPTLRLSLLGEGAFRYVNKHNNTDTSTFTTVFINPASPSESASSKAPMQAHWFTLNVDLMASFCF